MSERTIGETFTSSRTGKTYRPSMFATLTLDSYGPVRPDGTPADPSTYDYRRAALDALHFPKLVDRWFQNLRRCAGYEVQYFAAVEAQRRLAPHLHAALRGAMPRSLLRDVTAATYHQLWWPAHDQPVHVDQLPVWSETHGGYLSPEGAPLPTWDQALDALADDPGAEPAHVVRFGVECRFDGIIPGPDGERAIGYLCKYLTKDMAAGARDDEPTPAQRAHLERLHAETRWLPCAPECANWLRYGIQPKNSRPDLRPGQCKRRAHHIDNVGHGGRRVLVSRRWTGKTLSQHRADRAEVVRQVLAEAGVDPDEHQQYAADRLTPDGRRRWAWHRLSLREMEPIYAQVITDAVRTRQRWRDDYQAAKELVAEARAGPGVVSWDSSVIRQLDKGGET